MQKHIDNEKYIHIEGWMLSELKLKGNELLVYAIIYGFSRIEGHSFHGSLQYLADWTNSTRQGIMKNLKSLLEKGLINKEEEIKNGVKFVYYYVTEFTGGVKQSLTGCTTEFTGGVKQSLHNNIYNNINNNIDNNIDKEQAPQKYGNKEINELFDEWEKVCGFRIDSKIKLNRYACQRLIKSKGIEKVKLALPYVAESHLDKYAPSVNNYIDLAEKWNHLGVWAKKKNCTNFEKYGKIII